jgi:hypothetical protein
MDMNVRKDICIINVDFCRHDYVIIYEDKRELRHYICESTITRAMDTAFLGTCDFFGTE